MFIASDSTGCPTEVVELPANTGLFKSELVGAVFIIILSSVDHLLSIVLNILCARHYGNF